MANQNPRVNLNINNANVKIITSERTPLLLAQGTASGSYTSGDLITNLSNDIDELKAILGANSIAYIMARAFRAENEISRLDAIVVDDNGSGVPAAGSIVFGGAPTESGSLFITVGSNINNRFEVPVATTDTPTTLGDALVALMTADDLVPAGGVNAAGTVTLTALNDGTSGNDMPIRVEGSVAGLTVTLTAFASGAVDPVLTGVLDKIVDDRYDIISPIAFLSTVKADLNSKFNVDNKVVDGIGFVTKTDTFSDVITALASESSKNIVYIGAPLLDDTNFKGSAYGELDYVISTQGGALRAKRFVPDANISGFMQAGNTRGGATMAAIPYFNMRFLNLPAIPETKNYTLLQQEQIRNDGGTTLAMDDSRTTVVSNEVMLTSFDKSAPTPEGLTFKFLNDNDTLTTARKYIFDSLKERFSQSALYDGPIPDNIVGANREVIRDFLLELWRDLTGSAFGVLQGGPINQQAFLDSLVITIDTENGKVGESMSLRRTAQAREFTFEITPVL